MDPEFSWPTLMDGMRISFLLALLCWQNLVQTSAHEAVEGTLLDYGQPMSTCALSHECDIAQSHSLSNEGAPLCDRPTHPLSPERGDVFGLSQSGYLLQSNLR